MGVDGITKNSLGILNPENWRAPTKNEIIKHYQKKTIDRKPSIILFNRYLSPVDTYTYLHARFGKPNGFFNFLKSPNSDNLIHWDYLMFFEDIAINVIGKHRSVEICIEKKFLEEDWEKLVNNFRKAFSIRAKQKKNSLKSLEKWTVFVNRYSVLCAEAAAHHVTVEKLQDFKFEAPIPSIDEDNSGKLQKDFEKVISKFRELNQSCLALKLLTPIIIEAFLNLLILIMCKKEIKEDNLLYDAKIKEDLHLKVLSLHSTCDNFEKPIDNSSNEYKDFNRIMSKRNLFFHGNVDPKRDKLEVVYFDKNTPIFKTPGDIHNKYFDTLLDTIKPKEVLSDYIKAHTFIISVVNCIKSEHQEDLWKMLDSNSLGYNDKEKRFGILFSDVLISSYFPGMETDEKLF